MRHPLLAFLLCAAAAAANKPDRLEWFRDQGFGMFIHWSVDSQLGSVISHSMVGASPDYLNRFIVDLPKTFNPRKFEPRDWAALARLAGMKYVVFTAKHHSGFCMWPTKTTDYAIQNTPFKRDITREILNAFAEQGVAPGLYFSPDDFLWLHKNGIRLQRNTPDVAPAANPGLMKLDKDQVRELLTQYGDVKVMFFDGPPEGLRELAWELQPNLVVTRGAIETPEQYIPGVPLEGAWESCITMGSQWHYKPTNEQYKSGGELISALIETRAKGGNLLLNVGPKPDGELPIEQEERLREIALWMFVNSESIYGTRPWVITNEKDIWFTKKKDENTVYAIVKHYGDRWKYGEWRDLVLRSVRATAKTEVSVLGQNDRTLEYKDEERPKTTYTQKADGLHIRAMRAQRLYNDRRWPNPVVVKITNVEPALSPPVVITDRAAPGSGGATLHGTLKDMGKSAALEVGFQYRPAKGALDLYERTEPWIDTPLVRRTAPGAFSLAAAGLKPGTQYEFRAVVKHELITMYGGELRFRTR